MDFLAVLDQVVDLLRQRGRLIYHTLKRPFGLDDEVLADLKEELIDALRAVFRQSALVQAVYNRAIHLDDGEQRHGNDVPS